MESICVFGDSITYGVGDAGGGGWVRRWRERIEADGHEIAVYNLGIPGDNSFAVLERIDAEARPRDPDMILIAVGANDSKYKEEPGTPMVSKADFAENLKKIASIAKKHASEIVFVGLTNVVDILMQAPTRRSKFDSRQLAEYDEIVQVVASEAGARYISMLGLLTDVDFADGLHPNATGYEKMFARIRDARFL